MPNLRAYFYADLAGTLDYQSRARRRALPFTAADLAAFEAGYDTSREDLALQTRGTFLRAFPLIPGAGTRIPEQWHRTLLNIGGIFLAVDLGPG